MATPFLSSEEYDERAHHLYNDGEYDAALDVLKEGLRLYPHAVELYVGLGYTRLAREEFAWARQSFEKALGLDPDHEDAMAGLGETLLRFGRTDEARDLFRRVRGAGGEDVDLLLSMGRALYREGLFDDAYEAFQQAAELHPRSAEAAAALGYVLHRLGDERAARRELRRALRLDPALHEARVFLGHVLYERGDRKGALLAFERVPVPEHWDPVAVWRVIELKRSASEEDDPDDLTLWEARLVELEREPDPIDELLAELEAGADVPRRESPGRVTVERARQSGHRVRTPEGEVFTGTWHEIVEQLRDARGRPGESIAQFMRRRADEERERSGLALPADDPERFLQASARAGLLYIDG